MKQRIFYLDLLRSFAIVMVLVLHSISDYIVRPDLYGTASWYIYLVLNAASRTGVPIFLMISGYLMLSSDRSRDVKGFYKKSLVHIIIPLLFWNVAYYAYKCFMGYTVFSFDTLWRSIINNGTEYHLWYLYTLIGIYLLVPFLKVIVDNCSLKELGLLLFIMLLCPSVRPFINTVAPVYIYLFEPLFNGYISCFLMGYIFGKVKLDLRKVLCLGAVGIVCLAVSVIFHHTHSSVSAVNLAFNGGYSLPHFGLAAAVFVLARYIFYSRTFLAGVVSAVSKLSFGIYLVHVMVNDVIFKNFMIDASPVLISAYIFAVSFTVSIIISFILNKIKYVKKVVS